MGLQNYPSDKIANSNQVQLNQMLTKFKAQEVSVWKLGAFLTFNCVALAGLLGFSKWYVKSRWIKKGEKGRMKKSELTLTNLFKKGSIVGTALGGVYAISAFAIGYYTLPISVFKKYCQLQQAEQSFSVRYDPYCQQAMLYRKMKKFGLSEGLIAQIKKDLDTKHQELISRNELKKETVDYIRKAQQMWNKSV